MDDHYADCREADRERRAEENDAGGKRMRRHLKLDLSRQAEFAREIGKQKLAESSGGTTLPAPVKAMAHMVDEIETLRAENERLREALTPSAETRAAHMDNEREPDFSAKSFSHAEVVMFYYRAREVLGEGTEEDLRWALEWISGALVDSEYNANLRGRET